MFTKSVRRLLLSISVAILVSIVVFQPVSSQPPGNLYENPLTILARGVGTTFTLQIIVTGMDSFNGWDIQVATDPSVLNATGLSITGNMFEPLGGSPFEIVHCVNGKGTTCGSSDGPGIAHSAYANTNFASGNGLLFTITYQVVGSGPFAPLTIRNDLISSSSPSGVPHFTESTYYGAPLGEVGGGPRMVEM